jgi:hypothetical protein
MTSHSYFGICVLCRTATTVWRTLDRGLLADLQQQAPQQPPQAQQQAQQQAPQQVPQQSPNEPELDQQNQFELVGLPLREDVTDS